MIFSGLLVLPRYELYVLIPKSFIHKSRGEVSLVEQEIIDYVSTAYLSSAKIKIQIRSSTTFKCGLYNN